LRSEETWWRKVEEIESKDKIIDTKLLKLEEKKFDRNAVLRYKTVE